MSDATTNAQASSPEAELEQALSAEAESSESESQEQSAFEKLAQKKGFSSADDLAQAYENLEKNLAPTKNELKELRQMVKSIQESTAKPEEDPFSDLPDEQKEAISLLETLLERKLGDKLSPIIKKFEIDEASENINAVRKQYPGISDAEIDQAISLMEKYPNMPLDDAVKITSYDQVASRAKKNQKQSSKKRTFTESATSASGSDSTDYSKLTLSELEDLLEVPKSAR